MQPNYGQGYNPYGNNMYNNPPPYNQPGYGNQGYNNQGYNPQGYGYNNNNFGQGYGQGYPNQGGYNNSTIVIMQIKTILEITMGKVATIRCITRSLGLIKCTIRSLSSKIIIHTNEMLACDDKCSDYNLILLSIFVSMVPLSFPHTIEI